MGDFCDYDLESRAIIRYYAAKHGSSRGPNLIGTTLEERALMDQWLEVEAHNYNDLVFNIIYQIIILPQMGIPGDQAIVDSSKKKLDGVLNVYEERLAESKYLAGNAFTLADLSHLPATNYLMGLPGMDHLVRSRKNVNGWWEDISSRPAWKKVLKLSTS